MKTTEVVLNTKILVICIALVLDIGTSTDLTETLFSHSKWQGNGGRSLVQKSCVNAKFCESVTIHSHILHVGANLWNEKNMLISRVRSLRAREIKGI